LHLTVQAIRPRLDDVRELVLQYENADAKRKGVSPADRARNYYINEDVAFPNPSAIFVFDDVLTTGCHYKAMEIVLRERFPDSLVFGLFLARAVRPPNEDILALL
jgi:predicted amidophosphoribosyltransferase